MRMRRKETGSTTISGHPSFAATLGHTFGDPALLNWALTHRSLSYEKDPEASAKPTGDNEQLEFIGDAVLGLVVAESLFRRFPGSREGELTRLRASLVSRRHLAEVAARIALGDMLLLGRGEEASGGRGKPALLSNALEAVIAALYLDGGLETARSFIERVIIAPTMPELERALDSDSKFNGAIGDHKSALQEFLQSSGAGQPLYVLTSESGPDHRKTFRVEVQIREPGGDLHPLAESEATSKKQAEQQAARIALEFLKTAPNPNPNEATDSGAPAPSTASPSKSGVPARIAGGVQRVGHRAKARPPLAKLTQETSRTPQPTTEEAP